MTTSLHAAVAPMFVQILGSLGRMLGKAEAHCRDRGLSPEALTGARLAPDMWDLAMQVHTACVQSAGALEGALAGQFRPDYPPAPHNFASLQAMVSDAIARIKAVSPDAVDELGEREVVLRSMTFTADKFLSGFAVPNFVFHVTTAYAILRMQGVDLGKADFLGRVPVKPGL